MKEFLKDLWLFIMTLGALWFVSQYTIVRLGDWRMTHNSLEAIYIWGDSQTYQGVDLPLLAKLTNRPAFSFAAHGASVYDLAVFTERVPSHSTIVLGYSPFVFARNVAADRSDSGVCIRCLFEMARGGYNLLDLLRIAKENIGDPFQRFFVKEAKLFPNADAIVTSEPFSLFEDIFKSTKPTSYTKMRVYLDCLARLREKCCIVIVVDFPEHQDLQRLIDDSEYSRSLDDFIGKLRENGIHYCTPAIVSDLNIMHDYTHLNERGAGLLTEGLAAFLKEAKYASQ